MRKILIVLMGLMICLTGCSNDSKKNDVSSENKEQNNEIEESTSNSKQETSKYDNEILIYINNIEIKLGKTTVDEFLQKSGWTNYEKKRGDIYLYDGTNDIILDYYGDSKIIIGINTYKNNKIDAPDFDSSITTVKYSDKYVKDVSVGSVVDGQTWKEKYKDSGAYVYDNTTYLTYYTNWGFYDNNLISNYISVDLDTSGKITNIQICWKD